MINHIWFGLILIGVITGMFTGNMDQVSEAVLKSAEDGAMILIKLIGPMSLWLGIMKLAEESNFTDLISRVIRPITTRLFPEIPPNHPALGAIMLNISANILGLGNSATPLGINAMQKLQTLNPDSQRATNSMCTFLVINTSSVTLIPATIISLRSAAGSSAPMEIIGTTLFATTCSTIAGIIADRILRKIWS
ncbi:MULTISPECIES: nucleoside recognition domain-containing protein [unclassified Candidatus Frackibacter]|uniref:nucleoside recognition domain-containing protein n=1 Tax=unclassified Candidatus Frackibacter TaxID=2648818 RepID=UPI000888A349|nr:MULTISPECIES: nucleoside recognition domain-containing protein [unclassified Candidatus Frackibacter]SDC50994.1 spore maturation protein A [Candidatus Frackibacter sp. WG11]SEM40626.1 spore maturation protein A [Candidatus Frackibacter sp. WG12]SFL75071.1 spore maturation protein A [Candidatus Frackibacter sp. WG13]